MFYKTRPKIPIISVRINAVLRPNLENAPPNNAPNNAAIGITEVTYPIYSSYFVELESP